jgi:hypothetical protein
MHAMSPSQFFAPFLLTAVCVLPAAAVSIDLQVSTVTPVVDAPFTVQVRVVGGPVLTTSQVRLGFDKTKLQLLTAVKDTAAVGATPSDANVVAPANTSGFFYQTNDYASMSSSGTLTTLTFKALNAGASVLTLKAYPTDSLGCVLYSDSFAEIIPTVAAATTITASAGSPTNTAPVVNAGADQTITLPATASLNATVTDDNLPAPASLTYAWTKVSGPGTVTFSAPAAKISTATFSAAGTYVLQLTASDGALTSNDTLTVTVNAASPTNTAPVVNAGADQTITLPATASLSATVTDDGLPAPAALTYAWTKVSGPGTVTFSAPTAKISTATFSAAGTYVLQLAASDGALTTNDTLTITVNAAAAGGGDPAPAAGGGGGGGGCGAGGLAGLLAALGLFLRRRRG